MKKEEVQLLAKQIQSLGYEINDFLVAYAKKHPEEEWINI